MGSHGMIAAKPMGTEWLPDVPGQVGDQNHLPDTGDVKTNDLPGRNYHRRWSVVSRGHQDRRLGAKVGEAD
jgi:hypothetical protein